MTKAFRAKLLKAGALDTVKYRYAVYHGHAYDVIKRNVAARPVTNGLVWYKGVQAVILSALLFFFWFFSALFKASK